MREFAYASALDAVSGKMKGSDLFLKQCLTFELEQDLQKSILFCGYEENIIWIFIAI